ncbi:Hypothetical protein, putative [Bodo saltans]|uniref:Uncharacterized protein n=1 Tax=Bodo saltans TaxID=75058 RepID=A0A0S4J370_BODSA|nr:Hypothetical protein, putative [Bodo saltans]|eukprot:CUG65590.1 Hypothetical protein, putative [Bodo saltans]
MSSHHSSYGYRRSKDHDDDLPPPHSNGQGGGGGRPTGRHNLPKGVTSQLERLQRSLTNTQRELTGGGGSVNTSSTTNTSAGERYTSHDTSTSAAVGYGVDYNDHRRGGAPPSYRGARSVGSSEDYRLAARRVLQPRRRDSYEVESVSDDVVNRTAERGESSRSRDAHAPPLSPRRKLQESTSTRARDDRPSYHGSSSLGQRWSSAFADMESTLLSTPPVVPQLTRDEDDASSTARPTTLRGGVDDNDDAPTSRAAAQQPPRRFYDDPSVLEEQQAVSSSLERLELDALKRQSAELASLKIELKSSAAGHQMELQQLKVEHQRQVEKITEDFREAKMRLLDESHNRSHIAFSAKEELYKAEIETVQLRAKESETALESERLRHGSTASDLRTSMEQCEALRRELDQYRTEVERFSFENNALRRERSEIQQAFQDRDVELRACRHREQLLTDEKHTLQSKLRNLEEEQRLQELTTKDQMRKIEKEFTETNLQFEMLLNEASETKQKYERLKSKYKTMKDSAVLKEKELESALQHSNILAKDLASELESYQEQLRDAQAALARKEYEIRNERSSHEAVLQEIQHDREKSDESYRERLEDKSREVRDLDNLVTRLQSERNDIGQRTRRIESELDAQREASVLLQDDLQRLKGQHESEIASLLERHADAITTLKRKLSEKDRHIEQLIPTANESLQKVRKQLEDERSKRAALEQQIEQLRRLAKTAEETSRRELQKEQRRHPLYLNGNGPSTPPAQSQQPTEGASRVSGIDVTQRQTTNADHAQEFTRHETQPYSHSVTVPYEPRPLPAPSADMIPAAQHYHNSHQPQRSQTPPNRNVTTPPASKEEPAQRNAPIDAAMQRHEEVLASHKSVATEIFQRIMGSQHAFWQQCSDTMRRSADAPHRLRVSSTVTARARNTSTEGGSITQHDDDVVNYFDDRSTDDELS